MEIKVYSTQEVEDRIAAHQARAEKYTAAHVERRFRHEKHPVFDFLFDYYPIKPAQLAKWHPGVGAAIPAPNERANWRFYKTEDGLISLDVEAWWQARGNTAEYIADLLERTQSNPAHFDCFGMHEWAMVYKVEPRHQLPLRIGAAGTNALVEAQGQIRCTHYDAFRFFAPEATEHNQTQLTRESQPLCEQRGCLHATMDLYKWAAKLGPLVPGELWLDCFELAWDCRILDMEASPYDCQSLGLGYVPVESPEGKAEYVRRQRALSERAQPIRSALIELVRTARG
ncbi:MAG: 3-methyladenine DNA glycosylase [Corynebacterium sp.]|nr:3-methyladenine DNA glycosylase [Corynebacterium sp.]